MKTTGFCCIKIFTTAKLPNPNYFVKLNNKMITKLPYHGLLTVQRKVPSVLAALNKGAIEFSEHKRAEQNKIPAKKKE
jgi:hypothetical protein